MSSFGAVEVMRTVTRIRHVVAGALPLAIWCIRTCFYAWLAPWIGLAICWTVFGPSVESVRDAVIEAATKDSMAWTSSSLPQMWWAIQLVFAVMVLAIRLPGLPLRSLFLERGIDWLWSCFGQLGGRLSTTVKLIVLAIGLDLGLWLLFSHHDGVRPLEIPAPQPTNVTGAALLLHDGTAKTGKAEIRQQGDKSTYVVRFLDPGSR